MDPAALETPVRAAPLGGVGPILRAVGVSLVWPRAPAPVLDDVSLDLAAGEIAWVGGKNGVGKTTLLRVLAGIIEPQRGTVTIGECSPLSDRRAYARQVGFLSAGDRGLHARMRVDQQLDYWARLAFVPRAVRPSAVAREAENFGLVQYRSARVDRLSQGWRQRVRLAMAFLHGPRVVLLDEPRNSLDDDGYDVLSRRIDAAAQAGAAVLWCSPRGEDRVLAAHSSYTIDHGRLERSG